MHEDNSGRCDHCPPDHRALRRHPHDMPIIAVVAYQLGDAFTNFIVPTSGCLLGALAAAKLDWGKWAKFQIKFQAVLFTFGSIAVILAVLIGLS